MRELQQRQRIKKRMYSIPALIALGLFVLLVIKGTWNVWSKRADSIYYVSDLENQKKELVDRKKALEEDIEYLKTPEGIDEEIKERFNVAKTGERVVIIVDPKNTASTTKEEKVPWYRKFWNAIIPGR